MNQSDFGRPHGGIGARGGADLFKLTISFYVLVYLVPLGVVLPGHSLQAYLFYSAMVSITAVVLIATGLCSVVRRTPPPKDYGAYLQAPKFFIFLTMLAYLTLKLPEIIDAVREFRSGNLAAFMLQHAIDRYSGYSSAAFRSQLGTMILFCFFAFWGSRFMRPGEGRLNVTAFVFATIASLTESLELARAALLLGLLCFGVEYCIRNNQRLETMSAFRYLKVGSVAILVALIVFVFSAYFRVSESTDAFVIVLEKLRIYTMASYDLFFVWLDQMPDDDLIWGEQTFAFLWKLSGVQYAQGNYDPMMSAYGLSNIYLNLRGLIMDFGILITLALVFLTLFSMFVFSRKNLTFVSYMLLRSSLAILLFPIYSPFYFTVFALSFLLSGLCLCFAQAWRDRKRFGSHSQEVAINRSFQA